MAELWLNFTDADGYPKRILVGREYFVIGRHPDNDLGIAIDKLSREHLKIERFGDTFTVSDSGSSNGTTLNYEDLFESAKLRNGDILNLGGGLEITVEIFSERKTEKNAPVNVAETTPKVSENYSPSNQNSAVSLGGVSSNFFFIAPALGLIILLFVGGLFYAFSGNSDDENNQNSEIAETNEREETNNLREPRKTPSGNKTPMPVSSPGNVNSLPTPAPNDSPQSPTVSTEIEKVKKNATEFMRRIAQNDANPFLTQEHAEKVNQKIKNFKNSANLADNLRAVKRDASQIESLANSQNLKPQFLAAATLNEIGNAGGNPLETARTMLPILAQLKIRLDNQFADDNLLIIAAYDQGKQKNYNTLQSKLEGLSKTLSKKGVSVNPREMRTIWFLKANNKLTDAEFEYAVNFLAVGVIMQNPKDFGVNAEPVIF